MYAILNYCMYMIGSFTKNICTVPVYLVINLYSAHKTDMYLYECMPDVICMNVVMLDCHILVNVFSLCTYNVKQQ
jgi:hypothetical protein